LEDTSWYPQGREDEKRGERVVKLPREVGQKKNKAAIADAKSFKNEHISLFHESEEAKNDCLKRRQGRTEKKKSFNGSVGEFRRAKKREAG